MSTFDHLSTIELFTHAAVYGTWYTGYALAILTAVLYGVLGGRTLYLWRFAGYGALIVGGVVFLGYNSLVESILSLHVAMDRGFTLLVWYLGVVIVSEIIYQFNPGTHTPQNTCKGFQE